MPPPASLTSAAVSSIVSGRFLSNRSVAVVRPPVHRGPGRAELPPRCPARRPGRACDQRDLAVHDLRASHGLSADRHGKFRVGIVPPHALGPGVVLAVPDVPHAARAAARRAGAVARSDPWLPRFLLDGQTAILDDYLEVRPEAEPALRDCARVGARARRRSVDGPDGRAVVLRRDDRPRPADRVHAGRRVQRRD